MHILVFCLFIATMWTLANTEGNLDKEAESAANEAVDKVLKMVSGLMSNRMGKKGEGDLRISSDFA